MPTRSRLFRAPPRPKLWEFEASDAGRNVRHRDPIHQGARTQRQSFVLSRVDGKELVYQPGQWINLVLPVHSGEIRRAYSIASAPDGTPNFEVAVTEVTGGPGSGYLCGLEPGAKLRAIGPQGFFTREPDDAAPALFVATGTGITPLRSMLQRSDPRRASAPIWLLLGVRRTADLMYRAELEALASSQHANSACSSRSLKANADVGRPRVATCKRTSPSYGPSSRGSERASRTSTCAGSST